MLPRRKVLLWCVVAAVGLFVLVQAVPYGRAHDNPTPSREVKWSDERTRQLFAGACGDCHSFNTTWPWYSNVAPVSWLVQRDVDDGREEFNVSRWDQPQPGVDDAVEAVLEGWMPPRQYKVIHGDSRLGDSEKQALADGLRRTYQSDPPAATRGG